MEEMLKTLVKNVVDNPDAIQITTKEGEKTTTLELRVDQNDIGKVIGRQGRVAKAIRTLMRAYATKEGKKISIDIID